ncbi:hypothetical protein Lfu02_57920 [Longispora fulva]|nr:hypothetical protein Lfu02_57920 [Longispora fulva]
MQERQADRVSHEKATNAQDEAARSIPDGYGSYLAHIEIHRARAMVQQGEKAAGIRYAEAAIAKVPESKGCLSLAGYAKALQAAGRLNNREPRRSRRGSSGLGCGV